MQKPFDVVILGMGEDGHFASLFPGCDASTASLNGKSDRLLCTTAPNAPQERISWSMDALLESKSLMLYITGEKKRLIIGAAVKNQMPEFELPIGYFLRAIERQGKKLKIFWSA